MLYHYTDLASAIQILRSRIIIPQRKTLYRHIDGASAPGAGPEKQTGPIVWLSTDGEFDTVVALKIHMDGYPALARHMCRFLLPSDYPGAMTLREYTHARKIAEDWWYWVVESGQQVGSYSQSWRLVDHAIPACDWIAVELLEHFDLVGAIWTPFTFTPEDV